MHTRSILGFIDWHLITLFCALFIVIKGVEAVNLPFTIVEFLNANSIDIHNLYILTGFSTLMTYSPTQSIGVSKTKLVDLYEFAGTRSDVLDL